MLFWCGISEWRGKNWRLRLQDLHLRRKTHGLCFDICWLLNPDHFIFVKVISFRAQFAKIRLGLVYGKEPYHDDFLISHARLLQVLSYMFSAGNLKACDQLLCNRNIVLFCKI